MNRDLFLAILAMDSYNRGYGAGVGGLGGKGSKLGTAIVGEDAETLLPQGDAQAAGFYAIAYEWSGETVISYRGTDQFGFLNGGDFGNYGIGAGDPYNALGTSYGETVAMFQFHVQ